MRICTLCLIAFYFLFVLCSGMAQVCHCACKAGLHIHKHTQAHTHNTRAHTHTHTYSHANIYTHIHAEDEAGEAEATEVGIVLPALIPKLVHHACKLPVPVSLLRVERSSNQAPLSFALDDMLDALKRADSMKHHIHIRRSTLLNLQIVSIMPIGCALIVHNLSTFIILHVHALPNAHLVFEGQYLDFQMLKRFYTITHIRTLSHIRTHIHTHIYTHKHRNTHKHTHMQTHKRARCALALCAGGGGGRPLPAAHLARGHPGQWPQQSRDLPGHRP